MRTTGPTEFRALRRRAAIGQEATSTGPKDKLYLVVRADLPPGQQAVQACHAMRGFAFEHEGVERAWFEASNHLALLAAPDEWALLRLAREAAHKGLRVSSFREPDRDNEVTAIALEPRAKRLLRGLPLALRT